MTEMADAITSLWVFFKSVWKRSKEGEMLGKEMEAGKNTDQNPTASELTTTDEMVNLMV